MWKSGVSRRLNGIPITGIPTTGGTVADFEDLQGFFARYGELVAAGDLPGISACYALPALVLSDERAIPVLERAEIEAAFDGAAEQYRARGLVAARPTVLSPVRLSERVTAVDVRWDYLDEEGRSMEQSGYCYVLRTGEVGPLIQGILEKPGLAETREAQVETEEVIPVLRVEDAGRAVAWYRRLGFEKEWEHRFEPGSPAFVSILRGDLRLFLSEHEGDARPDTLVYLWREDLDALAAEVDEPVREDLSWAREISLRDPDGNRLRVGSPKG